MHQAIDPNPCLQDFYCRTWGSISGLMYVDGICGLVLLIEAAIFFVLLRRRPIRWLVIVPLALAVAAFALARRMWGLYWQYVAVPHFPPGWFDSLSSSPIPEGQLSTMLILTTLTILPAAAAIYLFWNSD